MNRRVPTVFLVIFFLSAVAWSATLDLPSNLTDYRVTSWTGGDGITLGDVKSLAQDRDGYLWLACDLGLVRFDGFRFAVADIVAGPKQLPKTASRAVYAGRDGSVWVGYEKGQGLYRIAAGEIRDIQLQGRTSGYINVIIEDRSGDLWVGHDGGLFRLHDGRWDEVELTAGGSPSRVQDVHEDSTGTLWVASTAGLFFRPKGSVDFKRSPHADGPVRGISESPSGVIWITDQRTGFRRADATDRDHRFEATGVDVRHDSKGNLWVTTTGQGVWQVRDLEDDERVPLIRRATAQTGLASDESSVTLEDRQGNIWVGSIQGLTRLAPEKVLSIIDIGVVQALTLGKDGTAWAGTTRGLFALTASAPQSPVTREVSTASIHALHTAADGTVWAGTDDGLHKLAGGRLVPVTLDGPPLRQITSISSDPRGRLWICDETQGLVRASDGIAARVDLATSGNHARPIFTRVDSGERVWIALEDGSVVTLDHGHLTRYGPEEGLSHTVINMIHEDRAGDIWIGGSGGLSHLRGGHFQTRSFVNEIGFRVLADAMDDDQGNLWLAVAFFGFIRVARDDLSRAMDDPSYPLRYHVDNTGYRAGYPRVSYAGGRNSTTGGAIWQVSTRGLIVLDPQVLLSDEDDATSIRPRIEGVTADDRRYRAVTDSSLPPRTGRLRIDYTVVNLSSSDRVRFRYRLDGFDTNWVDGTGPRQAFYTNLPPGAYRFRLQTSTNAAAWNPDEAHWSFSIQPMFYQTRWFYAVCALALGLCSIGAWQLRMRQVRKELALVFGERLRMGREIHDTLLQSLYGIALQLDAAVHNAPDPPTPLRLHVVRIRHQIEDYISEARQSISDLRSPALDRRDLVGALREMGDRLTSGKVSFDLTVTGMPRRSPSKLETHVLRIGHEAVMNAVRHANAGRVEMEIAFGERTLRLRVADDGRGFGGLQPTGDADAGHYGLTSMKERAADAGGYCTIESLPGAGVQVVAEFPTSPAS